MNVHLLRHGIAADHDPSSYPDDALRPLNSRGEKQVHEIAKAMRQLRLHYDAVWCSPFLRARQTAAAVTERLALDDSAKVRDELAPGGDPAKLIARLDALKPSPANVLLVGHEPYLSRLLSIMVSGGLDVRTKIKKGGLAKLRVTGPLALDQCAVLQWFAPPNLLLKISQ